MYKQVIPLHTALQVLDTPGELVMLGDNWFKCSSTGVCYRLEIVEGCAVVRTTRISKPWYVYFDRSTQRYELKYTKILCKTCGKKFPHRVVQGARPTRCPVCYKWWRERGQFIKYLKGNVGFKWRDRRKKVV